MEIRNPAIQPEMLISRAAALPAGVSVPVSAPPPAEPRETVSLSGGTASPLLPAGPSASENEKLREVIHRMPKADLHRHLEGSLTPEAIIRVAQKYNVPLPTYDPKQLAPYVQVTDQDKTLLDFIKKFDTIGQVFTNEDAIREITYQVVSDASKDNVKYLELRFSPMYMAQKYDLNLNRVIDSVCRGLEEAKKDCDTDVNMILIVERQMGPSKAAQVESLAEEYKGKGVVGLDLANDEANFPPGPYAHIFQKAKAAGLSVTIHAGEAGGAENVRTAIEDCHADRIGHGVRMEEDPAVEQEVIDWHIPVEICPTSNVQTGAVASIAASPFKRFMDKGIPVVINTDDPGVSNTTLTDEYLKVANQFGISVAQLQHIVLNGVDAAFISTDKKKVLHDKFQAAFNEINK
ncbi:MAG: adenosine deaminase [bacterium]